MIASSERIVAPELVDAFLQPFFFDRYVMNEAELIEYLSDQNLFGRTNVLVGRIMDDFLLGSLPQFLLYFCNGSPFLVEIVVESSPKLGSYHVIV